MSRDTESTVDRRSFLRGVGAGTAAALGGVGRAAASGDGEPADEVIVGVDGSASVASVSRRFPAEATVADRNDALGYVVVELPGDAGRGERIDLTASISRATGVKYVEANRYLHAFGATEPSATDVEETVEPPDDPLFADQYAPQLVNAPGAWGATRGEDVTVAVVDQGVMYDHPDLADRFGEQKGRNVVDDGPDPYPKDTAREYHGTHVAGIAAGTTGNGTGVAGVSDASLLSVRVLDETGRGRLSTVAEGIQWAADQSVDVINLSLGDDVPNKTLRAAVDHALQKGALPVAAAGNDGLRGVAYPAAFDACLAVGAVDDTENVVYFSQYGASLDVVAPGKDVLSCWTEVPDGDPHGGKYNRISGTSMASPAAAGAAALALSGIEGDVGPDVVRYLLKDTARDVGEREHKQGAGLVDAAAVVKRRGDIAVPTVSASADTVVAEPGYGITFRVEASGDPDGEVVEHRWEFDDGSTAVGREVTHAFDSTGRYGVTVTAVDDEGITRTDAVPVQVREPGEEGFVCGEREFATMRGRVTPEEPFTTTYEPELDELCRLNFSAEGTGADVDLYLTMDGRTPTTDDYDRRSARYLRIDNLHLEEAELDAVDQVGLLVTAPAREAYVTLTVEEVGIDFGSGGDNSAPSVAATASPTRPSVGEPVTFDAAATTDPDGEVESFEWRFKDGTTATGPVVEHAYDEAGTYKVEVDVTDDGGATATEILTVDVNAPPEPSIGVDSTTVAAGEWVTFDASDSTDPDGEISSAEWSFGDGVAAANERVQHAFASPGEYTVTLTVTDDAGESATATRTITVEDGEGVEACGTLRETATYEDSLHWLFFLDENVHYYTARTADPCQVVIELEGPDDADFDLWVTNDGTTPNRPGWFSENWDKRSRNPGSSERVVFDDPDPGQKFGVDVFADSGKGEYTLTVREIGKGQ